MNKISRYILKKCLINTTIILFAFTMIYYVVNAISELGNVGKGNYTTLSMFIYLAALLPSYIYLLIPLATLIGVMTSMLGLVKTSEYAIMRTSGISLNRITGILAIFGIFFAILTFTIGEIIAPEASNFAKIYKLDKMAERISSELSSGIWSKDGEHNIINIKQLNQNDNENINNLEIFAYDDAQNLKEHIIVSSAKYDKKNKAWILINPLIYKYITDKILVERPTTYLWHSTIEPNYFNVLIVAPEDMPAFNLLKYIHHLRRNNQATNRHEIALWNKLLYPIACISMSFIAIGFIPNNSRSVNLSTKLFFGILIGIAFFFTNKLVGFMAILFNWNAVLSAIIPTLILFIIGWVIILRKEA